MGLVTKIALFLSAEKMSHFSLLKGHGMFHEPVACIHRRTSPDGGGQRNIR